MNTKSYSGIGSRETPNDIMSKMTKIAGVLQDTYTLRSGAAPGADTAFEDGVTNGNKEIYLPWKGFNKNPSKLYDLSMHSEAEYIASQFHPRWQYLKRPAKLLMTRNVYQVLGSDLNSKSAFVLCWTPDSCMSHKTRTQKTGGTGQAISIASCNDVPIINMNYMLWEDMLLELVGPI